MSSSTETPRRRRFVMSLRALMLLVLVVGGLIGWRANRARTQRRAVAAIRASGGYVSYDFQRLSRIRPETIWDRRPPAPAWLCRMIGDEYFQEVTSVQFAGPATAESMAAVGTLDRLESFSLPETTGTGDGLAHLRGLSRLKQAYVFGPGVDDDVLESLSRSPELEALGLMGSRVTDAGLGRLAGLVKLRSLNLVDLPGVTDAGIGRLVPSLPALAFLELGGTDITDAALASVCRAPSLKKLDLSKTRVTDAGLSHLVGLAGLEDLWLGDTAITDEGLEKIAGLTGLLQLELRGTAITDAGLSHLAGMTELVRLDLGATPITGDGFARLGKLQKLSFLALDETSFSDAGMPHLAKLAALREVYAARTRVSDAGLATLQGGRPYVTVHTGSTGVIDPGYSPFRNAMPGARGGSNKPVGFSASTPLTSR